MEASEWQGKYRNRSFTAQLRFTKDRRNVEGSGFDEVGAPLTVHVDLKDYNGSTWTGFLDTGEDILEFDIDQLNFNEKAAFGAEDAQAA